ncbi:MAG TPA: hypothetical protein VII53_09730 [Solirubrobacteraceae bacterium]
MRMSLPSRAYGFVLALLPFLAGALLLSVLPSIAFAEEPCPNEQARVANNSTRLPDCRVYELVSPGDNGGPVSPWPLYTKVLTTVNTEGELGGPNSNASGLLPGGNLFGQLGASALDVVSSTGGPAVFWESRATPPGTGALPDGLASDTFRAVSTPTGWSTQDVLPYAFPFSGRGEQEYKYIVGASADGSAALVVTNAVLTPSAFEDPQIFYRPSYRFLYRVSTDGSPPELVDHGEDLIPPKEPNSFNTPFEAVSASPDLNEVAFESEIPLEAGDVCNKLGNSLPGRSVIESSVYLWNMGEGRARTIVSLPPGCTAPNVSGVPTILPDGRPVVYPNPANPLGPHGYTQGPLVVNERNVSEKGALTPLAGSGGGQLLAVSPDGSTAYVQSTEALSAGAFGTNIYAISTTRPAHAGEEGTLHGVVCVSCASDGLDMTYVGSSQDGSHVFFGTDQGLWSWDGQTATLLTSATDLSQILSSQNGQFVVGITSQALSGKDTNSLPDIYEFAVGQPPQLITSGTTSEDVYRLEEASAEVLGAPDSRVHVAGGVSNDGLRVVYDHAPAGGGPQVIDEWLAGETRQISPQGSPSGYGVQAIAGDQLQDVFFLANEPLVSADGNTDNTDVYDARIDGGFPPCTSGDPGPPPGVVSCLPGSTQDPSGPPATPYPANLPPPSFGLPPLPSGTGQPATTTKALTRAQKLSKALKACKRRPKKKRATCVKRARKQYAPATKRGKK